MAKLGKRQVLPEEIKSGKKMVERSEETWNEKLFSDKSKLLKKEFDERFQITSFDYKSLDFTDQDSQTVSYRQE